MAIQYLPAAAAESEVLPPPASPPTEPATAPTKTSPPPSPSLVLFGRNRSGKPRAAWFTDDQAEAAKTAAEPMKLRALPITDDARRALAAQLARGRIRASGKAHVPGARRDLYARLVALMGDSTAPEAAGSDRSPADPGRGPHTPAAETGEAGETGVATEAVDGDQATPPAVPAAETSPAQAAPCTASKISEAAVTDAPIKPRPGDGLFVGEVKPTAREQIGLGSIVLAHEGSDDGWWEAEIIGFNSRVYSLRWRDFDASTYPTILRKPGELALLPPGDA